jgi:replicative DNA helicase
MAEPSKSAKSKKASGNTEQKGAETSSQKSTGYLPDIHRTLPHSADAEQGLLGSMLIGPRDIVSDCVARARQDFFHVPAHGTVFETLVDLWNRNVIIDLISLTQSLKDRGQLDAVGGPAFVTQLFTFVPTAANAGYYLEIVREKYILRQIITNCTRCAALAYDDQENVNGLLDEVEQSVFSITQERARAEMPTIKEQVMAAIESIEKLYDSKGAISGLPTGLPDLDTMTDGLHEAEMIVIAARPSMGKTALAMNIAEHIAVDMDMAVAVFSLEMSAHQLVQRLICSRARVSLKKIREGFLAEHEHPKLTQMASKFAGSKLFIDDTPGLSILELRAKARRLKSQHDIKLIVIDYLQLLKSTSRRAQDNRQIEISEISSGIKALAKELSIPIIVLAQLNRNPEARTGSSKGRPRLSDLRESGSIEQDADVVGLLTREEYYAENDEERAEALGKATLIIAKQRNGPVGDIPLTFIKEFTRFEPRAADPGEGE